jgi:hypothetical protein
MRIQRLIFVCGLAAAGGLGYGGLALSQDSDRPDDTPAREVRAGEPMSTSRPQARGVGADAARDFAVLRRGRRAGDTLSAQAAATIGEGEANFMGANPGLSRLALRDPDGVSIYALPGDESICMVSTGPAGSGLTCTSPAQAAAGYLIQTEHAGSRGSRVQGLLPDGVEEVTVTGSGAAGATTEVTGNAYSVKLDGSPGNLQFKTRDGAQRSIAVPFAAG